MAWFYLLVAAGLEIIWAIALKQSAGLSRPWPTGVAILGMLLSFGFLALATRTLPIGTSYAVWTGIGAVGTAILGIVWLGEAASPARLACIGLIVLGIAGLKLTERSDPARTNPVPPIAAR